MAKKRVDFYVKTSGAVNSKYLWVEERNVTLRDGKGHLFLEPRTKSYDLMYFARGGQNATIEITTESAGKVLSKEKDTIVEGGKVYGVDSFKLATVS